MHIIDSHQHFWKFNETDYDWIDDSMSSLKQDYLPSELARLYGLNGIDGCVSVQALPSENENNTLIALAAENPFIKGVVGWINLCDSNVHERLEYFRRFDVFKGVRMVLQNKADDFMSREDFLQGLSLLEPLHLTYDLLINPKHLFAAFELVKKYPNQLFVIDHLAKPYIRQHQFDNWKDLLSNFTNTPNVYCKVSGMVTEADWKNWKYADFTPALDAVADIFGPDRLMYGSDWPVCLLAGSYKNVLDIAKTYFTSYSMEEQEKIFYNNAVRFYNLDV